MVPTSSPMVAHCFSRLENSYRSSLLALSIDLRRKYAGTKGRTRGGFLLHYLDKLIYPEISLTVLTVAALIVCALNLGFYIWRLWVGQRIRSSRKNTMPDD